MIILGIDPGTTRLGYGIIEVQSSKLKVKSFGTIGFQAGTPPERLKEIYIKLTKLIKQYQPDRMGIEQLFFSKNQKTAMRVSQAHGVAILTAALADVPVAEFTPPQVKQAVSGYGSADKGQVQRAIKMVLNLKEIPKPDDAADALAVAITCCTEK